MTAGRSRGMGRGLRATPHLVATPVARLALVLLLGVAACGGTGATGSVPGSGTDVAAGSGSGADPLRSLIPARIGDLELELVSYTLPEGFDGMGGERLATLLRGLDLTPAEVSLVIGIDRTGLLAIGRWELPGKDADAILAAWQEAAGAGWESTTLGGIPAVAGRGPDGSQAWAVAWDGVFVYVVTDERQLAEEAVAATR